MGTKLTKAPVYFTVAQVQFNSILNLDSYLSAIQAKMRETHQTDFKQEMVQSLVIPPGIGPNTLAAPSITAHSRYIFGDISGNTSFVLEPNTLALQTTNYDSFEGFLGLMLKGLRILHELIGLDFVDRIGLRYLDAIQPLKEDESLKDYLIPEVLGLSLCGQGELLQSQSETISMTAAGQLISRVVIRNGKIGLPMELASLAPKIADRFLQPVGLHGIVDTDGSYVHREAFELGDIEKRLVALHDEITASFRTIATQHAQKAWA